MKKLTKSVLALIFLLLAYTPGGIYAAEYQDVIDEITNLHKNSVYNIDLNAPYSKDTSGIREKINPENGSLSVNLGLFGFKGRGGDEHFALSLTYSSLSSSDMEETAEYNTGDKKYYNKTTNKTALQKSMEPCIGWGYNLPYIEVPDGRNKTKTYIHLPGGAVYEKTDDNTLKDYTLEDVIFTDTAYTYNGNSAKYRLIYSNGDTWYFDESGYPIGKSDKFSNSVQFIWSDDEVPLLVHVSDNCSNSVKISYENERITFALRDRKYTVIRSTEGDGYLLQSVTDPMGRITKFSYNSTNMDFGSTY